MLWWTAGNPAIQPVEFMFFSEKFIVLNEAAPMIFDLINQANNYQSPVCIFESLYQAHWGMQKSISRDPCLQKSYINRMF